MDDRIILPDLVQMVLNHRSRWREVLSKYPDDVVANAFLDGIVACDHPQSFTAMLIDVLQRTTLPPATIARALDTITGPFYSDGTRAACLSALRNGDGIRSRLEAAGLTDDEHSRLEELAAQWPVPNEEPALTAIRLMSEFEVRRAVDRQLPDYEVLIAMVSETDDFDVAIERLSESNRYLVLNAMVHELLRCPADERRVFSLLASHTGHPTSLAHTRLVRAAVDATLDLDLRSECLLLDLLVFGFVDIDTVRDEEPWCDMRPDDLDDLQREYSMKLARFFGVDVLTLKTAARYVDGEGLETLCDEAIADCVELDWKAILHEAKLEPLGPRAAEELATAGDTSVIEYLEIRADIEPDVERAARYRRAAIRLRAL